MARPKDIADITVEAYILFSYHGVAQARFGVSAFWLRRIST